ncbi:MAG: hypothetical protein ACI4RF_06300, partial [Eubacterium sp.]
RSYTSSGSKPYNNISAIMGYGVPDFASVSSGGSANQTTKKSTTQKTTAAKTTAANSTTKKAASSSTTSSNNNTTKNNETTFSATEKETTQAIKLDSLSITVPTYDLQIGDTVKLSYSVEPSDAPAVVGYFCDEEGIIEIGTNGSIKAIGSGTATVVVCANDELYKQCDFNVTEAVGEVTTQESKERKVVGTTKAEIVTTEKSIQSVLTNMGVNINALSQNKQLYLIPAAIAAATFFISVFVAITKKIMHK